MGLAHVSYFEHGGSANESGKTITLSAKDRAAPTKWSRSRSTPARLLQRAKIIVAVAESQENHDLAAELGFTRRTVGIWRIASRRPGSPKSKRTLRAQDTELLSVTEPKAEIIRKTTKQTPPHAKRWSVISLAKAMGVSEDTVRRIWRDSDPKPHRTKRFTISNDPHFVDTLVDVGGLYLDPPDHARVLSCEGQARFRLWIVPRRVCRCFRGASRRGRRRQASWHHNAVRVPGTCRGANHSRVHAPPSSPAMGPLF